MSDEQLNTIMAKADADLDALKDRCHELYEENERLTNNWNELEEFIQKELDNNVDGIKSFGGYQCKIILDKMKEIKEGNDDIS